MENAELTKLMMNVKEDIAEIKTDLKYILENCKTEKACLEDIDQRVERIETWQNELQGAWKLLILGISAGVFGFVWNAMNWIKTIGK